MVSMRGAIVAAMVLAGVSAAQNPVTVSGVVVDTEGRPVVGAWLDHLNMGASGQTDMQGRFDVMPQGRHWVIRKPGYESQPMETRDSRTELRIVLRSQTQSLPSCERVVSCKSLGGAFCFPKISGVTASGPHFDSDSASQSFSVRKTHITHGKGALWGGLTFTADVWSSAQYRETAYPRTERGGTVNIIDARGKTTDGTYWRSLGLFGESAFYHDVDQPTAALFDKVLDGVCLLPSRK